MAEGKAGRKLGRTSAHRKSLLSNLASELFIYGQLKTTLPKAKELRRYAEKLITKAKKGGISNRRLVCKKIKDERAIKKLFENHAVFFKERKGGYTRIYKLGYRSGDNACVALIKLVDEAVSPEAKDV